MAEEYRVTIRLDADLYAQLEARGSQGQPLAAIVRQALVDYLARQPDALIPAEELAMTVAATAASLAELRTQVEHLTARVDALAARRPPVRQTLAATGSHTPPSVGSQEAAMRQPEASWPQPDLCPPFDTTKHRLGRLCPRGHEWGHTGQSLLRLSNHRCRQCDNDRKRERRAARQQPPS